MSTRVLIIRDIDNHPTVMIENNSKFVKFSIKNYFTNGGFFISFIDNLKTSVDLHINQTINVCYPDKLGELNEMLSSNNINIFLESQKVYRELGSYKIAEDYTTEELETILRSIGAANLPNVNFITFDTSNKDRRMGKMVLWTYTKDLTEDDQLIVDIKSGYTETHKMIMGF